MFTGLVDDIGVVDRVARPPGGAGLEIAIRCRYHDLEPGESVAVNGVCLTVRDAARPSARTGPGGDALAGLFTCAAMTPTVRLTTIGEWDAGRKVNLERALRPTDRLGGHIVQGHVDGVATVVRAESLDDALALELALPGGLAELMVERGSVAVDGVSLTISSIRGDDIIEVSVIEYTRRHTTLGGLAPGDRVHVEADILAKHVRKLLGRQPSVA